MVELDLNELNDFEFDSEFDTNGDGVTDTNYSVLDTSGDGYADTEVVAFDTNNNGIVDTIEISHDSNGDGYCDTVVKMHDYNQDGVVDSINTHSDIDGDGQYELLTKEYDSTGDGEIDTVDVYFDVEGNGHADVHEMYAINPDSGELVPTAIADFEIAGTYSTELSNFNPDSDYNPEDISGNPAEAMEVWEFQGDTQRCALYSQKFVIEELTGQEIDIEDFVKEAKSYGWFTEDGGTTLLNMNNMLDKYDVENEMSFHNSVADIENCLNNGGKVIVSIDCHEIWYGEDNNIFAPDSGSNHAVEVIGIDHSDPENPFVILNDSGSPYGRGEMVPLDVFEGAWEDGDCQMVTCYKA